MIVVLQFPAAPHPIAQDMNYTIVVVGGTVLLATGYYFISGRYWFVGPVVTAPSEVKRDNLSESSIRSNTKGEHSVDMAVLNRQWSS